MTNQSHLPYEKEVRLFNDIVDFFTDRLPHAVGETVEHVDEAVLSAELFQELSSRTDEELSGLGIYRDELSKVAASASGLFFIANNRHKH